MKYIVIFTKDPNQPPEKFAPYSDEEADIAVKLYKDGFIREMYSRGDGKGAIAVIEANSEEEILNKTSVLPFVKLNLLKLEIYEALPYRGLIRGV